MIQSDDEHLHSSQIRETYSHITMASDATGTAQKLADLAHRLRQYKTPKTSTDSTSDINRVKTKSNRAAVLICLFEGNEGELRVILTKRSSTLSSNPGDVALPGGKFEEGDANDVETALREASEEIGLDPSLVNVVTVLESFTNKKGVSVVPVIGILEDKTAFVPTANTAEVETIFDAPLEMFLKDENRTQVEREWMGEQYALQFFDHEAEGVKFVIWALTAGILIRTASIVYERPPLFREMRPSFWSRCGL